MTVEVDRSVLESLFTEFLSQLVQGDKFHGKFSFRYAFPLQVLIMSMRFWLRLTLIVLGSYTVVLQNFLHFFVAESAVASYHGVHDAVVFYFSLIGHEQNHGVCHLILILTERAEEVAQVFREHRDGSVHQIDGGGTVICFLIDDGVFFHVVGYISYMHAHFPEVPHSADGKRIVEVFRIFRVNGKGCYVTEIFSSCNFLFRYFIRNLVGLSLHVFRVEIRQAVFSQDGMHFGIVVSLLS